VKKKEVKPKKRSRPQKAKVGRKDSKAKVEQDIQLRELFNQDGITPWSASIQVKCGYEYAVKKFKEFGQILTDAEDENWIERQDKVRKRALEGITTRIKESKKQIEGIIKRRDKMIDVQESILPKLIDTIQETEMGALVDDIIGRMDHKVCMAIYKQLGDNINMYKNYAYLVEQIQKQLQLERTFEAELQQQYDGLEIMPPPSAVLEAEIEKSIAAKNELFAPKIQQPEVVKK